MFSFTGIVYCVGMNRNVVYEAINSVSATKQMKQREGIQMDRARFVFLWLDGGVVAQLIPILNVLPLVFGVFRL